MPIRLVPTSPTRNMTAEQYVTAWNNWLAAFPGVCDDFNAFEANVTTIAAGGGFAVPFTIDTSSTANADPGNGKLRFNNASQGSATALYVDILSQAGSNIAGLLDLMAGSTSAVKGKLRLVKVGDATKWITFEFTAIATSTSHRTLTVTNTVGSSASPFANNDLVMMFFERTGDAGAIGPAGTLTRRTSSVATTTGFVPNASTQDMLIATAQAATMANQNPTGTLTEGQTLMFRVKDNGVARAITWGTAYRAGADLALPASTIVGKWLYVGFAYNLTDAKWDLLSSLNV